MNAKERALDLRNLRGRLTAGAWEKVLRAADMLEAQASGQRQQAAEIVTLYGIKERNEEEIERLRGALEIISTHAMCEVSQGIARKALEGK